MGRDADFGVAAAGGKVAQELVGLRFAAAVAVDSIATDDFTARGQPWGDLLGEHPLEFGRDARQCGHETRRLAGAGDFEPDSWSGADGIGEDVAACGELGLNAVSIGHLPAAFAEHFFDRSEGRLVEDEGTIDERGQSGAGQVIECWTESAGDDHDVRTVDGNSQAGDVGIKVVGDARVVAGRDAKVTEFLAEPLGVGVQLCSGGDFGSDGDDFGEHGLGRLGGGLLAGS